MLQWMKNNFKQKRKTAGLLGVLFLAVFFVFLFQHFPVEAQTISTNEAGVDMVEQPLGLPSTDIRIIIARVIRAALGLLGIILLVIIIYAGYLWMTAGGNDEQIGKAKSIIRNAVIGLVIVLSSYAITQFIISKLLDAIGGPQRGPGVNIMATTNFQGSGALGHIIRDHYPMRNQVEVPRNTSIFVTFTKPVRPESFIDDSTGDGIYGNCKATIENWWNDCDRVKNVNNVLSDTLINIKKTETGESIFGAVALTSSSTVGGVEGVFTIVLKPITRAEDAKGGFLGSETEKIMYSVRLGPSIELNERNSSGQYVSAFEQRILGNNYYEWSFTTSLSLDFSPPTIKSVFPVRNTKEPKNTAIQIEFSEPINPIGLQGSLREGGDYYYVEGWNIFLRALNSALPAGSFNLVSNYQILEFVSSKECGINSCGNQIFCLPVCDGENANCTEDVYRVLLRAAHTIGANSFEAVPLTGVMDAAGNALDGNDNGRVDDNWFTLNQDPGSYFTPTPDNYAWNFTIEDRVDSTSPYLETVMPGPDASSVVPDQELSMTFSKRMLVSSLHNVKLEQKEGIGEPAETIPLCYWHQVRYVNDEETGLKTKALVSHCPFLEQKQMFYIPTVTSTVVDVHYNCFYPGRGPDQKGVLVPNECDGTDANCCNVGGTNKFCCNGDVNATVSGSEAACRARVLDLSR